MRGGTAAPFRKGRRVPLAAFDLTAEHPPLPAPAFSRWFGADGSWSWRRCTALDFDPECGRFLIEWDRAQPPRDDAPFRVSQLEVKWPAETAEPPPKSSESKVTKPSLCRQIGLDGTVCTRRTSPGQCTLPPVDVFKNNRVGRTYKLLPWQKLSARGCRSRAPATGGETTDHYTFDCDARAGESRHDLKLSESLRETPRRQWDQ